MNATVDPIEWGRQVLADPRLSDSTKAVVPYIVLVLERRGDGAYTWEEVVEEIERHASGGDGGPL